MDFKGGLLLDESVNLGDVSTASFGTPLLAKAGPDFEDSPIAQPRFSAEDDESEDERDIVPVSPLDDRVPAEPKEVNEDSIPPSLPERDRTPTPKADPEPQTPSRRQRIQITMETETVVVCAQLPFSVMN